MRSRGCKSDVGAHVDTHAGTNAGTHACAHASTRGLPHVGAR